MTKEKGVIKKKEYFELLSSVMGTPVLVWDGEGHSWTKEPRTYANSKSLNENKPVPDIVRYNGREIIFDLDNKDWKINKVDGEKKCYGFTSVTDTTTLTTIKANARVIRNREISFMPVTIKYDSSTDIINVKSDDGTSFEFSTSVKNLI